MKLDNTPFTRLYTTPVANIVLIIRFRTLTPTNNKEGSCHRWCTLSNRPINERLRYKEENPACSSESQEEDEVIFYRSHPLDPPKDVEIITDHIKMRPQGIERKHGERFYQPHNMIGSFESALKYQYGFDIEEGHANGGAYTFDWDDKGTSYIDLSQIILARKKEKKLLRLARSPSKQDYNPFAQLPKNAFTDFKFLRTMKKLWN